MSDSNEGKFHTEQLYNILKRKVWPYQKFILEEKDLWFGRMFEKVITKHMKIDPTVRDVWWNQHKNLCVTKFSQLRNNVISKINNKLRGKTVLIYLFHLHRY